MVIAEESSGANLRWASNTLTTNGVTRGRQVVVIAMVDGAQGTATGVLSRSNPDPAALDEIVAEATAAARDNEPADDAMPLITAAQAGPGGDWAAEPAETSIGVFAGAAEALGAASRGRCTVGRRTACCSASPNTPRAPSTSAPRPGCGCATSSRPAGWS